MLDTQQQLVLLKQRIAAIDDKFKRRTLEPAAPVVSAPAPEHYANAFIQEWSEGQVVSNAYGEHFQTERLFPSHRPHGSADVGALSELDPDLLQSLAKDVPSARPEKWAFLDTETTGLMGGSGTYAFLIGVGQITSDGFRVRQFFMREYVEEPSVLTALEDHLSSFDVLITYNGKSYDQPLLETRYRMNRSRTPFARLSHVDLLYGARRIWKLRLNNCRLMQLEQDILGFYRDGDVPGELIPYIYFDFLRSREACRIVPILHHNAMDILTLACLSAIVPAAFRSATPQGLTRLGLRRGEELLGMARWLITAGESEGAISLLKRAIEAGLPDALMFRATWDLGQLEKKADRSSAAIAIFTDLASCPNPHRTAALEELAKHYEHREKNYAIALDFTTEAMRFGDSPGLEQRKARLQRRLQKPRNRRLL